MARPFRRTRRGVETRLTPVEADLLRGLAADVMSLFDADADPSDAAVARLFPDAYGDDQRAADEFRSLTVDDLREGKRAAAQALAAVPARGGDVVLDDETADLWLTALNDIRLALGARLGVTEESYDELLEADPDDPATHLLSIYMWLGMLQESLVDVRLGDI